MLLQQQLDLELLGSTKKMPLLTVLRNAARAELNLPQEAEPITPTSAAASESSESDSKAEEEEEEEEEEEKLLVHRHRSEPVPPFLLPAAVTTEPPVKVIPVPPTLVAQPPAIVQPSTVVPPKLTETGSVSSQTVPTQPVIYFGVSPVSVPTSVPPVPVVASVPPVSVPVPAVPTAISIVPISSFSGTANIIPMPTNSCIKFIFLKFNFFF